MFYNGASCDIYIGKGAGKKLLADMSNAQESVKIVSPYLSPFLIKGLIAFNERNIQIQLITTDNIEEAAEDVNQNILKLILQNRKVDKAAVQIREKWQKSTEILISVLVIGVISFVGVYYFFNISKMLYGFVPAFILLLVIFYIKKRIKNTRIYSYWYSQLFPFKVYQSPYTSTESNTFIHSKIYVIDNKIAYLGSLNFTASGTKHNYETRIRTEDEEAVYKISAEFDQLMQNANLPEIDIQKWGSELYPEPIN